MLGWNEHVGLGNRILSKRRAVRSQLTSKIELRAGRDSDEKKNLEKLKTKELRAHLASLRLETTREKAKLRARLQAAVETTIHRQKKKVTMTLRAKAIKMIWENAIKRHALVHH